MSNKEIRELLARLQDEIRNTELDEDTRALVRDLDEDIHGLLSAEGQSGSDSVLQKAKELETNFATEHPTIERFMREDIDALVRMGI